jgi:glycosyltransferase involved in cell wall biosynthesis
MVSQTPSVSVVVATFNGASFLEQQLESILGQTLLPREIVVSDDASTDATLQVVDNVRKTSPSSVLWQVLRRKKSVGVAENFRLGVLAASSDLVALADQDDWFVPTKLAKLADYFSSNPDLLLVHSDAELVGEDGQLLGQTLSHSLRMTAGERKGLIAGRALAQLVRRNLVTGHTVVTRRKLVELAGPVPDGWLHDEWWALVAAGHGGVVYCPEILGHYRQHEVNQVGATRSGLGRFMERLGEHQNDFRSRHETRHRGLESFLDGPGTTLPAGSVALLRGRIAHYRWQATLPPSRLGRVVPVLRRLLTGHYHRFRRGLFDALRDLFQPGN